jgi:transposase-like protein
MVSGVPLVNLSILSSAALSSLQGSKGDDTEPARQRYECHDCNKRFDDLTDTISAGHHQPLKVWILCLYFMGLNLSSEQIAHELSINESDAYQMTTQMCGGIVKKACRDALQGSGM